MRTLTRTSALILTAGLLATAYTATASAFDGGSGPTASERVAFASSTTDPTHPLQVYGEDAWPLRRAIGYWNDLAGREVIHYAGPHMAVPAASDPHTVVVMFDALTNASGVTVGVRGRTPQAITIDSRSMFEWEAYARQFGHALGYWHDNGPGTGQGA